MAVKDKKKNKTKLKGKKARLAAELKAKRIAAKGDGSFPDRLVVTREKDKGAEGEKAKSWFLGHAEDLSTIYKDETTVAVYKLVRVSKVVIKKKIALNRG